MHYYGKKARNLWPENRKAHLRKIIDRNSEPGACIEICVNVYAWNNPINTTTWNKNDALGKGIKFLMQNIKHLKFEVDNATDQLSMCCIQIGHQCHHTLHDYLQNSTSHNQKFHPFLVSFLHIRRFFPAEKYFKEIICVCTFIFHPAIHCNLPQMNYF